MNRAREIVSGALRRGLPEWAHYDRPVLLDKLDRITTHTHVIEFAREPGAPLGAYDATVEVHVISPKATNWHDAEVELETALIDALDVIEAEFGTAWERAEKTIFQKYLAWKFTVHVLMSRKD